MTSAIPAGDGRRAPAGRWSSGILAVLALVMVLGSSALVASSTIASAGDRAIVGAARLSERPFRGIVLITVGSRSLCTGFVVGPRKVATAAHCLTQNPQRRDFRLARGVPDNIRIYRGYSAAAGGTDYPICRVSRVWAHSKFVKRGLGDQDYGSHAHDIAVLTTGNGCRYPADSHLRMWATEPLGTELPSGTDVRMAGYPSDPRFTGMTGLNLWRSRGGIEPSFGPGTQLYVTGFVAQGMSGAPLWRSFGAESPCDEAVCVVGVVTECEVNGDGLCRLGSSIRRAVRITPSVKRAFETH